MRDYKVSAGDLRDIAEVLDMTGEQDEIGGQSVSSTTPRVVGTIDVQITPMRAIEKERYSTTDHIVTHKVICRINPNLPIRPDYHLRITSETPQRVFAIASIVDGSNRHRVQELMCEEVRFKP